MSKASNTWMLFGSTKTYQYYSADKKCSVGYGVWEDLTIACLTPAICVCFYYRKSAAILLVFLCSLFYLKGTNANRIETITIL